MDDLNPDRECPEHAERRSTDRDDLRYWAERWNISYDELKHVVRLAFGSGSIRD
jgi:hypothetical protein